MDILKCPWLIGEPLKNSLNVLSSCNFQVMEQMCETKSMWYQQEIV